MRRRVGIVAGACIALALAGVAGVTTFVSVDNQQRQVGTWHDAPAPQAGPAAPQVQTGRERVGSLSRITTRISYAPGPRRHTFRYPQASYVKLHFDRLVLRPGDYVTVSDAAGRESYRYAALPAGRWAMSITGDTAVLQLHTARGAAGAPADAGVGVDLVARGHTPRERAAGESAAPAAPGREESLCGTNQSVDAACYRSSDPVAWTRTKAIARLLINGTELCTGWRISARNRMLTNNHCFSTSTDADRTEVWFNYQCAKCGGSSVVRPTKVWGEKVITTHRSYDYTLFSVAHFDRIQKYGYLSIDTRRPARGTELYVPQHPAGEPAKISGARGDAAGNCAVVDPAYDGYAANTDVSYYCDTEGGSSGSPVLSRDTDKVVALHHFGGCPNSGVRADLVYSKIKKLL